MDSTWNGTFHMDSMDYSRWIPLDSIARHIEIPWENIIKCVIKNSNNNENPVLYSAPPIPAGILRNPQESAGMGQE